MSGTGDKVTKNERVGETVEPEIDKKENLEKIRGAKVREQLIKIIRMAHPAHGKDDEAA